MAFGNNGLHPPLGACSAIMAAGVYGRNYDFQPRYYGARLALLQTKESYASIGATELLMGRLDGMNEHGLTIGLHLVRMSPRAPGLSCVLIVRAILDQCATTADAVAMLRRLPHAMRYNYSLLDAGGVAAVVEAHPGTVAVRTGDWLACTNHFQSPLLRPLNRRSAHSQQRLPALEAWAAQHLSAEAIFSALKSVHITRLSSRLYPGCWHTSYDCCRAEQATRFDRNRRRCGGSGRGHVGREFYAVGKWRGFANRPSRRSARWSLPAL